jgi:hypothetical protein
LRRLLLPKTEYHLYFALERDETVLVIHSRWGRAAGTRTEAVSWQVALALPRARAGLSPPAGFPSKAPKALHFRGERH